MIVVMRRATLAQVGASAIVAGPMRIRAAAPIPRARGVVRVAFLHPGKDPASEVPFAARSGVRAAVRATGFAGKPRELVIGRGVDAVRARARPRIGRRAALGSAARAARTRGAAGAPHRAVLSTGASSTTSIRSVLPHVALADYSFDRYKSKREERRGGRRGDPPGERPARPARSRPRSARPNAVAECRGVGPRPRQHAGQRPRPARARAGGEGVRAAARAEALDPRPRRDRPREDGRPAGRQRRQRAAAGLPGRRVRAARTRAAPSSWSARGSRSTRAGSR